MKISSANYTLKYSKANCNKQVQKDVKLSCNKIYSNIPYWAHRANSCVKNVSFSSNLSSNNFKNWLLKNGINPDDKEELYSLIESSINEGNYLGTGTEQIAYSIKNNDNYILKYTKDNLQKGDYRVVSDEFPTMNLGQTIAEIGNVKICKKQEGIESSIPYAKRIDANIDCQKIYLDHLLRTKRMPQKAYDELALTFAKLNEKEKTFDYYNPNNILVDTKHNKFNIVDDLKNAFSDEDTNTFMSIVNPLIDIRHMPYFKNQENIIHIWQEIITKSFIASERAGLPIPQKDISSMNQMFKLANINPYALRINEKYIA